MIAIKNILTSKKKLANRKKYVLLQEYMWKKRKTLSRSISENNFLFLFNSLPTQWRYWMMDYNQARFENMWSNRYEEVFNELWSKEFRLHQQTFEIIENLVAGSMDKRDTNFRNTIKVEKCVALVTLWLSTGNSYRTVSIVFRIEKSTVFKIVHYFSTERRISSQFIKFPKNSIETAYEIQNFRTLVDDN